jgi:hypothetical protein
MRIRAFGASNERFVRDALLHGPAPPARAGPPDPHVPLPALWPRGSGASASRTSSTLAGSSSEWELVDVIRDEGRSAKDLRRPGLQAILAALPKKQRGWGALIVVKLDRLTRSVKDLAGLTEAGPRWTTRDAA